MSPLGYWKKKKQNKYPLTFLWRVHQFLLSPSFWLFICIPLMGGCSWFFDEDQKTTVSPTLDLPTLPYTTIINVVSSEESIPEVDDHLKSVSLLVKLESRPPTSLNALYSRIKNDMKRLQQALSEKGYFDGQVDFALQENANPLTVTITYKMGTRYRISKLSIMATENARVPLKLTPDKAAKYIKLKIGDEVDLSKVQEANQRLAKYFRDHGYPFGEMGEPEGILDRSTKQIHIIFRSKPGTHSSYSKTTITGLKNLDPQFVRNRLVWEEGKSFDERNLEKTRLKLMGTGLFSAIEIQPDETYADSKNIPILLKVTEGPPRTIGAGLKYATSEGIGGQAFWTHRNIFGSGEMLGLLFRVSPKLSKAKIDLDIPDIFAPEQYLRTEVSATREINRAYTSRVLDAGIRLEHPFTDTIKGSVGITGESGRVKRANTIFLNRLLGFPVAIHIDKSNDLINPTKGGRLTAQVTPYFGRSGKDSRLLISTAKGSYYLRLMKGDSAILAAWAHGGTIAATSIDNIAPNKRFYAGGAGSVRAYGYKLLGPLDANRIPIGGRSILEYGIEGRFKVTDTIGFVLFAEAGSLSTKASPDLSNKSQLWGVGAGLRYYTSIGPLRFDIATPLKRRRDGSTKPIDSSYQFYLSIGQAF